MEAVAVFHAESGVDEQREEDVARVTHRIIMGARQCKRVHRH
jgi:hypothetical protein